MLVDGLDIFFGIFLGVWLYIFVSAKVFLVAKSCGGGCKKLASCGRLLWENCSITNLVFQ